VRREAHGVQGTAIACLSRNSQRCGFGFRSTVASVVFFVAEPAASADSLRSAPLAAEPQAVRRDTHMSTKTVYVARLDLPAGSDCWRALLAEHVDGELFRIVERPPEAEVWEFRAGDLVQCRLKTFAPGLTGFVAYAKVDDRA
jgi:hypothetical protein